MTSLEQHVVEYLTVRRAMGYKLARAEKLLGQFTAWMTEHDESLITTELALEWATLPAVTDSNWQNHRLGVLRGFAAHLHAVDPAHEVPPSDLLAWRRRRSVPYLYSDAEVIALMNSTTVIPTPHRAATMATLIGLLAATGMRVGEAIRLNHCDIDPLNNLLTVCDSKFGKSREVPVHASTIAALQQYLKRPDRPTAPDLTEAVLTSAAGTRLLYSSVHLAFLQIVKHAGLTARSAHCRPRPHDLRHTFAVKTMLDAYASTEDPATVLPLLSTYLGHVHPGSTYWYLQAAPELLALAGDRLQAHLDSSGR